MELGVRILERLEFLGISQSELARRAKIPQTTINSLIRKPRRSSPHLVRIARELQTTPAYLTGEVDDTDEELPDFPSLTSDERVLLDLFRVIEPKDRAAIVQLAKSLASCATLPTLHDRRMEYRAS